MKPRCYLFWLPGCLSLFWLASTSPLQAQILQDATLPNPSIVTPNGNTTVITGGTQAGSNLFHSFSEFSISSGGVASFQQVNQGIENVISRVTGSSISNINGTIAVLRDNRNLSSANFFLINPNGIVFGPNARLNVGGSFIASTASSLNFADGAAFSATNHQTTTPLLTMSVPIGLQFGKPAASIQVQGAVLQVPSGKTLGLAGGELTLIGGALVASGGRIEVGSIAGAVAPDLTPVQIGLNRVDKGWAFSYSGIQNFQDIRLSQRALISASGQSGGDIQVQGRRVTLTEGSRANANTQATGAGGTLAVRASESVEISGSSTNGPSGLFVQVGQAATGTGGNLTIDTGELLVRGGAQISTSTFGSGKAGDLTVRAADLVEVSGTTNDTRQLGSRLQATGANGDGGNLTIETGRLLVRDGGQIEASTSGSGRAGNLTVQNARQVELIGGVVANGSFRPSGLFTQTRPQTTGTGGNLSISTDKLTVREGAQINSTTFGAGRGGDLTVRASEVELTGVALSADGQLLTDDIGLPFTSGLFTGTGRGSTGDGGDLILTPDRLRVRDGAAVQTSALGSGDAGDLTVRASEFVELTGTLDDTRFTTGLLAGTTGVPGSDLPIVPEASGQGGNLTVETGELIVRDGAVVAVSNLSPAPDSKGAGNLEITAQTIRLDNRGRLTAETDSGEGGNIALQVQDFLVLRRESNISTTAGTEGAGGNGGDMTIDAPFIIAIPSENSDITANAFTGNGGNIEITTQGIFGIQFREEPTPLSDITASSEFGVNGVVIINTPDVDPSRGLAELPSGLVDPTQQIARGCRTDAGLASSKFYVTGRGGLPFNPNETLNEEGLIEDLGTLVAVRDGMQVERAAKPVAPPDSPPHQIVEAQGWIVGSDGTVILTAQPLRVTPQGSELTALSCQTVGGTAN